MLQTKTTKVVSYNPDFTSLMAVGDETYMVTQFESPQPAAAYVVGVNQDKASMQNE